MYITFNSTMGLNELNKKITKLKPQKLFDANLFVGKVKWGEDALEYQKKLRNEWDYPSLFS